MKEFDNACLAIATYLARRGWEMTDDGTFLWIDPTTKFCYPTIEAFTIQSYLELKEFKHFIEINPAP